MTSLQELRNQIDDIDRMLIASLLSSGEGISCPISELKKDEIIALQNTGLIFSIATWDLLAKRMEISKAIGKYKYEMGVSSAVDKERKELMILDRIAWAPENLRELVHILYEIIHDISVRIQKGLYK